MSKEKAIEITKNLKQTLDTLTTMRNKVESVSTAYEGTRAKRSDLLKRKKELMNKYDLTEKDLK